MGRGAFFLGSLRCEPFPRVSALPQSLVSQGIRDPADSWGEAGAVFHISSTPEHQSQRCQLFQDSRLPNSPLNTLIPGALVPKSLNMPNL